MPFLPEQFTTVAAPQSATNQNVSGNNWTNLSGALSGTTGSSLIIPTTGVAKTTTLQCAPPNASSMSPINDGADITRFIVTGEVFTIRSGIHFANAFLGFMVAGTQPDLSDLLLSQIEGAWIAFNKNLDKATYFPGGITGQQVKNGTYGPGFYSRGISAGDGGTNRIRLVKVQIGFQNPVPDSGPLLYCEA